MQNSDVLPELFRMQFTRWRDDRDTGSNECQESICPQIRGKRQQETIMVDLKCLNKSYIFLCLGELKLF